MDQCQLLLPPSMQEIEWKAIGEMLWEASPALLWWKWPPSSSSSSQERMSIHRFPPVCKSQQRHQLDSAKYIVTSLPWDPTPAPLTLFSAIVLFHSPDSSQTAQPPLKPMACSHPWCAPVELRENAASQGTDCLFNFQRKLWEFGGLDGAQRWERWWDHHLAQAEQMWISLYTSHAIQLHQVTINPET